MVTDCGRHRMLIMHRFCYLILNKHMQIILKLEHFYSIYLKENGFHFILKGNPQGFRSNRHYKT